MPVWKVLEITRITRASLLSLHSIVPAPGSAACDGAAPLWIFPNKRFGEAESVRRVAYSLDQAFLENSGEALGQKALVEADNVKTSTG